MSSFPTTKLIHLQSCNERWRWLPRQTREGSATLKLETECRALIVPQRVTSDLRRVNCPACFRGREERLAKEVAERLTE